MSEVSTVRRPAVALALAVTLVLALAAFTLSFVALADLAERSGIPAQLAWLWPLVVDGTIIAATGALVAMAGHDKARRLYPWGLLLAGSALSVAGNSIHAVLVADSSLPSVVAASVAAVPPLALLALTHLSVSLVQRQAPKAVRSVRRKAPEAVLTSASLSASPSAPAREPAVAPQRRLEAVQTPPRGISAVPDADRESLRERVVALRAQGLSFGAISAETGAALSTCKRWAASAA